MRLYELLQTLVEDMRVDLRGRDIGMAEHLLHGPQIGTIGKQMTCKGMAERVWGDACGIEPCGNGEIFQELRETVTGEMTLTSSGRKQPG